MTDQLLSNPVAATIVQFLRRIGLAVEAQPLDEETVLPGIQIHHGVILIDPTKLKYPGDLLHEAGHLAVKPEEERRQTGGDVGNDPAEEMMAIAWSYAALVYLQLSPEVVFHAQGYRGGSQALIDSFTQGHTF